MNNTFYCVIIICQLFNVIVASQKNDEKCPVFTLLPHSKLSILTESSNPLEEYWIKPGEDFKRLLIQTEIENKWDLSPPYVSDDVLELKRDDIFPPSALSNKTNWSKLTVKVFRKTRMLSKDKLVVRAVINKSVFNLDNNLWWRQYQIKKFIILGEGEVSLSAFYCRTLTQPHTPSDMQIASDDPDTESSSGTPTDILLILLVLLIAVILLVSFVVIFVCLKKIKRKRREQEDSPYEELNHASFHKFRQQEQFPLSSRGIPPPLPPSLFTDSSRLTISTIDESFDSPELNSFQPLRSKLQSDAPTSHYNTPRNSSQSNLYDIPKMNDPLRKEIPSSAKNTASDGEYLVMSVNLKKSDEG